METANRVFETLDALKSADQSVFQSGKGSAVEPDPTCSAWHLWGALPKSSKTYPQIRRLFLQDCSQLNTFTWAKSFPNLEKLWVYGSDKISDIDGIQAAKCLKSLTIWPSFSATITLNSLSPISSLENLEELVYSGRTRDGSLEALNALHKLKTVFFSNSYPWQEVARFEDHHPEVDFRWKGGVVPVANPSLLKCKNCGTPQSMLTGKGLRLACPNCDSDYIEKHLKRYTRRLSA